MLTSYYNSSTAAVLSLRHLIGTHLVLALIICASRTGVPGVMPLQHNVTTYTSLTLARVSLSTTWDSEPTETVTARTCIMR
jgi:hypothetical protein